MKMVAAIQKKFPVRICQEEHNPYPYTYILNEKGSKIRLDWRQDIENVLGSFIVSELGKQARMAHVNETIKLWKLSPEP